MESKVPRLIYGTAWKKQKTKDYVYQALCCGFRAIDTACQPKHYNEAGVGQGIAKAYQDGIKRQDLFIQTKFTSIDGQDQSNMPYEKNDNLETQVRKSFQRSKKNLQTNYLDSLVLHSPIMPYENNKKVWKLFQQFYKKGEVKNLGISNCYDLQTLKKIYNDAEIKPKFLQNRFYKQSGYDVEIRKFCDSNDIKYQSFWSLTANDHILDGKYFQQLSHKYKKTQAQIFFRFLTYLHIIPLIGSTSKLHLQQDLAIFDFELEQNDIANIKKLLPIH